MLVRNFESRQPFPLPANRSLMAAARQCAQEHEQDSVAFSQFVQSKDSQATVQRDGAVLIARLGQDSSRLAVCLLSNALIGGPVFLVCSEGQVQEAFRASQGKLTELPCAPCDGLFNAQSAQLEDGTSVHFSGRDDKFTLSLYRLADGQQECRTLNAGGRESYALSDGTTLASTTFSERDIYHDGRRVAFQRSDANQTLNYQYDPQTGRESYHSQQRVELPEAPESQGPAGTGVGVTGDRLKVGGAYLKVRAARTAPVETPQPQVVLDLPFRR